MNAHYRSSALTLSDTLSELIAVGDRILYRRKAGENFSDHLAQLSTAVWNARRLVIEGGNPLGAEGSQLVEALLHVEQFRHADRFRLETWSSIAHSLLALARHDFAELIERSKPQVSSDK